MSVDGSNEASRYDVLVYLRVSPMFVWRFALWCYTQGTDSLKTNMTIQRELSSMAALCLHWSRDLMWCLYSLCGSCCLGVEVYSTAQYGS